MTDYRSHFIWDYSSIWYYWLQFPFSMTDYMSHLVWDYMSHLLWAYSYIWYDSLHVPFSMTDYMSQLVWQTICPIWYDRLHVSYSMTDYMSHLVWAYSFNWYGRLHLVWQTTDSISYDRLQVWYSMRLQVPFSMPGWLLLYRTGPVIFAMVVCWSHSLYVTLPIRINNSCQNPPTKTFFFHSH